MRALNAVSVLLPMMLLAPAQANAFRADPDCASVIAGRPCAHGPLGGSMLNERDGAFIRFLLRHRPTTYDNWRDRDGDKIRQPQLQHKYRTPSAAFA